MSRNRRSFLAAAGAGTLALSAGCLGSVVPSGGSASLLLNWKPNGLHVPYYAAKAQGFYEEEGVTLEAIESGDGSDVSAQQAGLGNTEFGVTSSDQILLTAGGDLDIQSVGTVMQQSPNVVFATRESLGAPLTDPQQLAGTRIGTGPGMAKLMTELYLDRVGVRDQVEMVDAGYDTVQYLLDGDVDAAGGVFGDAVSARYQGATVDSLKVNDEIPTYGHVLATSPSYAEENPGVVRGFLRATAHGAAWAVENPEAGVDALIAENEGLSEVREQTRATWDQLASGYMTGPAVEEHGWGWSEQEPWTTMADALSNAESQGEPADPSTVWTNDYLDTDSPYIGEYASRTS